jgi:hypothetical protein
MRIVDISTVDDNGYPVTQSTFENFALPHWVSVFKIEKIGDSVRWKCVKSSISHSKHPRVEVLHIGEPHLFIETKERVYRGYSKRPHHYI